MAESAKRSPSNDATIAAVGLGHSADARTFEPGDIVGRYVVLARLGAGGMGVVHAAYDPELDRKVAIKVLHAHDEDMRTDARGRLVREAQALAKLAHPNVVSVHDVGAIGDRVWVAMEHVEGTTLTRWAAQGGRSWRDILGVMMAAGRGLAAAHRAGLIHRDFKPDNVMVAQDGRVLVMDFGLARPLDDGDDARGGTNNGIARGVPSGSTTALTRAGSVLGTPAYMAPEQHAGTTTDARADQFGFCVSLWELLHGERPFEGQTYEALVCAVMSGQVRPAPPHAVTPKWLRRALERGLRRDPAERWPSMDALLGALGSGSRRRRRARIVSLGLAVALVAAGSEGWRRLSVAREVAACEAAGTIIAEVWPGEVGSSALRDTFDRAGPDLDAWAQSWSAARTQRCIAALESRVAPDLHELSVACLVQRREALVQLLDVFGDGTTDRRGRIGEAVANLPRPSDCTDDVLLRARPRPPEAEDRVHVQDVRRALERSRSLVAAGRYAEAKSTAEVQLEEARALGWEPLVAEAELQLGVVLDHVGDSQMAATLLNDAFVHAHGSGEDATAFEAGSWLVWVTGFRGGRHDEALAWGRVAGSLLDRIGTRGGLDESGLLGHVALVHYMRGDYDEAEQLDRRVLSIRERVLGPDHLRVAAPLNNLAMIEQVRGSLDEAVALYGRALEIKERVLGTEHPDVARALSNLATLHLDRGAPDEAAALQLRALAIRTRTLGPGHAEVGQSLANLGNVELVRGDLDAAEQLMTRALAVFESAGGTESEEVAQALGNLSAIHVKRGDLDRARPFLDRALAIREKVLGPDHPEVAYVLLGLADIAYEQGDAGSGLALAERALAIDTAANAVAAEMGRARFAVARGLWETPGGRRRALELAAAARDSYRETSSKEGATVEQWLAAKQPR